MRVVIDISKPLKKGSKIEILGGGNELAIFKYEKLPDFCYICGRLDHQEIECEDALHMKIVGGKVKREYEPWMSTESADFLLQNKGGVRNLFMNSIDRGGRSTDDEGYCLSSPLVQE